MFLSRQQKLINNSFIFFTWVWDVKKLLTGVLFFSVMCVMLQLNWISLFIICWFIGGVSMCAASYVGVGGSLYVLGTAVFTLLVKSLTLTSVIIANSRSISFVLGDYAALTDNFSLTLSFTLDYYSMTYILLTNTIGFWALFFATNYMRNEPRVLNFLYLLYFFLLSMILLLAAANFPTLMLGWELIGCFSFLLINFWTTRIGTAKSAFKAFFFNKLSDASLIVVLVLLIIFLPNTFLLNFQNLYLMQGVQTEIFGVRLSGHTLVMVFLIICSFCKSAQFGLHVWLPDSMEAPVPASALIHSATLVSAGIFLLGRVDIFLYSFSISQFLALWCAFTALYGGVVAAYQTDLKKILAYSTISHCGFLFLLVTYNNFFGLALYLHLHGWFKSYSFMAAGNLISKYLGYQDYRRMGGAMALSTFEALVLTLSIACLGGLPFLLGFFNKHYLLMLHYEVSWVLPNSFILAAAFTGLYYTLKTVYSLWFVNFKSTYHQSGALQNGLNSSKLWVTSEPLTNVLVLGFYPVFISVLTVMLLVNSFWVESVITHSIFGIFFFLIYLGCVLVYLRSLSTYIVVSYFFIKNLYVL